MNIHGGWWSHLDKSPSFDLINMCADDNDDDDDDDTDDKKDDNDDGDYNNALQWNIRKNN